MKGLIKILSNIRAHESAQIMQYRYAVASGRNIPIGNNVKHATLVSKMLVKFGKENLEDTPAVECGGNIVDIINKLLGGELELAGEYNDAKECGAEVDEVITDKNTQIFDLFDSLLSQDSEPIFIVIGSRKIAVGNLPNYLYETLQLAWYKHGDQYKPIDGYNYIVADIQDLIENLWEQYKTGEPVKDSLQFYVNAYKWITSPSISGNWDVIHKTIWPDYEEWLQSDTKVEEKTPQPTYEQTMEQVQKELKQPAKTVQVRQPTSDEDVRKELQRLMKEKEVTKEPPSAKVVEEKVKVYAPGKSRTSKEPNMPVGVGDRVKNMTIEGEDIPAPGRPGRAKFTEGQITGVNEDGTVLVETGAGVQEWDPTVDLLELDMKDTSRYLLK